jgi:hypothetical protein
MVITDKNQVYKVNNSEKKKMSLKGMCMHHRTQKAYPRWSHATDSACRIVRSGMVMALTEVAAAA